jgi:hypothetical protein
MSTSCCWILDGEPHRLEMHDLRKLGELSRPFQSDNKMGWLLAKVGRKVNCGCLLHCAS